jgi:sigma-B regulation protein RsbU (phosphoserine phosphatase)
MFVTVLYAVYDTMTGEFIYSSGGHDSPLVVHSDGSSILLPMTGGVALGVVPDYPFEQHTVTIAPGDTVILYTDGVTEAMNGGGEQFGIERLQQVFIGSPPASPQDASRMIFDAVSAFAGDTPQSDDLTCLTLQRRQPDS